MRKINFKITPINKIDGEKKSSFDEEISNILNEISSYLESINLEYRGIKSAFESYTDQMDEMKHRIEKISSRIEDIASQVNVLNDNYMQIHEIMESISIELKNSDTILDRSLINSNSFSEDELLEYIDFKLSLMEHSMSRNADHDDISEETYANTRIADEPKNVKQKTISDVDSAKLYETSKQIIKDFIQSREKIWELKIKNINKLDLISRINENIVHQNLTKNIEAYLDAEKIVLEKIKSFRHTPSTSKYDPIIDAFLSGHNKIVSISMSGTNANYLKGQLKRRIKTRRLGDITVSVVNDVCYLEK